MRICRPVGGDGGSAEEVGALMDAVNADPAATRAGGGLEKEVRVGGIASESRAGV